MATAVAALGYFVDIFDLLLFALVRRSSLQDVLATKLQAATDELTVRLASLPPAELAIRVQQRQDEILRNAGVHLDNILQMTGLVVGGILWGVLADRYGRMRMLFGSIIVYSIANILNAIIADVPLQSGWSWLHTVGLGDAYNQYAVLRFVAGVGLAGELGAGITLVSELVSKERRGIATTLVATVGIMGAVVAYFVTQVVEWRTAYLIGGLLGIALLFLRVGVVESGMFDRVRKAEGVGRGAFWMLLYPSRRALRYVCVIVCAVPIWYCVGVLVKYCDVLGASLGMHGLEQPNPGKAIMWCYVGLALGDLASGLLSQIMRSRRRAILVFHGLTAFAVIGYFTLGPRDLSTFYLGVFALGFSAGYWAVFVATAAEQFGTNLRATAATTAPNFVRWSAGMSAVMWHAAEWFFGGPENPSASWQAAALVGAILLPIAALALLGLRESFGTSLDWTEDASGAPVHAPAQSRS
ncbi:MAG: MFS transporter [Phycisphaerae bacterium]|nr:MFS transporter [Phycisphaerae bacterium]